MGEVCPQPVEEVRQCGFRVHFDFGELWGAVMSPLLLFVLLKAAQSGHRHKKKFVAEVSSITPHDNTSGMSQVACGSDHGLSAISRDVWLAASSQTNFTEHCAFQEVWIRTRILSILYSAVLRGASHHYGHGLFKHC